KNIAKYVMMPGNAKKRHPFVEERMKRLRELAETTELNRVEYGGTELGIITSSTAYQYVREVFGDTVSVLKIGLMNPLPDQLIRDFANKVKRLVVVEELDPIIEEHVRSLGLAVSGKDLLPLVDEFSQSLIAKAFGKDALEVLALEEEVPGRPPVMCAGCPHRGLFYVLRKLNCTVLGDIGCYTLGAVPPLSAIEMTLCMGASIGAVHGFNKVRGQESEGKTVAVIGDSTFVHSGMTGLANVAYNGSNSTVIILDNSITGMTGHQQNPTTGYNIKGDPAGKIDLEALCRAMGIERVAVVDPYDLAACEQVIKEELSIAAPSVIISRRPCALLKYVKHEAPLSVDQEKCVGCKACMQIGCPAISFKTDETDNCPVSRSQTCEWRTDEVPGSSGRARSPWLQGNQRGISNAPAAPAAVSAQGDWADTETGKKGHAQIDPTLCVGCKVCSRLCKFGALRAEEVQK
ncbi:MAG: 4Fe-4S binding protein, partial [Lachnospiraceae bacterium]|nr:4Fe-4S binding protein [Lachnospiraceae bacterium]